jgi:tripartite-type tricarboxylate transporter receptor subunit TctC
MAGELFKTLTGIDLVHVPYRGNGPAMTALLGGEVQVGFGDMASAIEFVKAGKLRGLAVTTADRSPAVDLPTVAEVVPGYEASSWFGIGAPKGTPAEIITTLNREINRGLADAQVKARLANVGGTTLLGSAADFGRLCADETEKWAKVVKTSGAKAE